jgi:Cu(I)/Ag(I) efflux system membrane fusion protein
VAGSIDDNDAQHRRLSAYVDGRIEKLFVNYLGAEVREGEPLALMHSPMLLSLVREYQAMARPPAGSKPLPEAEQHHLLQAAARRLELMGLSAKQIERLAQSDPSEHLIEILAPMSGTVVTRDVYAGQYVKEGDRLFELADFRTMWFKFDAYEQDLAWLRPGQAIEITAPAIPGRTFRGTLDFIDPNLNDATRSAKIRVDLDNPLIEENGQTRRQFLHRTYAEGTIRITLPESLTVPRSAILNAGGEPLVYVDQGGGAYRQQKVRIGRIGDDRCEVLEGLSAGDRVVTSGNLLLDAQAQIHSSSSAPAPRAAPAPAASLTPGLRQAAATVVESADRLIQALGRDDLAGFNALSAPLFEAVRGLDREASGAPEWHAVVEPLAGAMGWKTAASLEEARKAFHPVGSALVEIGRRLRGDTAFATLRLFQCPMTKRSFPGAPSLGLWIQTNTPVHNPFFGPAMLDCGTEIQP